MKQGSGVTGTRRVAASFTGAGLVATGFVGLLAHPVAADTFLPGNLAPTIGAVVASANAAPAQGGSTAITVAVPVTDLNSLDDLNTVVVCAYHSTAGDATCATPNPAHTVKMTYTVAGNVSTSAFSISSGGSTSWALSGSTALSSGSATLGTATFGFKVGEVAREGTWRYKVTVADQSGAGESQDLGLSNTAVAWYGEFTSAGIKEFGTITQGSFADMTKAHTVQANGGSKINYSTTATWASANPGAGTLALDVDGTPGSRAFSYACNGGNAVNAVTHTYITTSAGAPAGLTSIKGTGTAEGGEATDDACRVYLGTAAPSALVTGTVTMAIATD